MDIGISISDFTKKYNKYKTIQIMLSDDDINIPKFTKNKNVFIHSSYKVNIAEDVIQTNNGLYSLSFEILNKELQIMQKSNIKNIILHTGINKKLIFDKNHIYDNITKFIKYCLINYPNYNFILETSAGETGELLSNLNDFVNFILFFKNYKNLYICIYICHIYQAGYYINKI